VSDEIAAKKDHVSHRSPLYGREPLDTITIADRDLHAARPQTADAQLQLLISPESLPISIERRRRRQITDCHDDVECEPDARHNNSSSMIVSPKRVRP
jgi:hypothetical protein